MIQSKNNLYKLPILETIKRTFLYVLKERELLKAALPIVGALIVFEIILLKLFACDNNSGDCSLSWQNMVTKLAFSIVNIGIIINYCRQIVLKEKPDFTSKNFWKLVIYYSIAILAFTLLMFLTLFFAGSIISIFTSTLDASPIFIAVFANLFALTLLIIFAPLFLIFPCVAVEDYETLNIKKLFDLAKGNHLQIFSGLLLSGIPCLILLSIILMLAITISSIESIENNPVFVLAILLIQVINTFIRGSYYAHIYQYFKFVEKQQINKN